MDSDWDLKNDWDGSNGSAPVAGGDLEGYAKSLMRSETEGEEVAPWGAAWAIAVENGWKPPKWAKPPREIDISKLSTGVAAKVKQLKEALVIIDDMDSPRSRCGVSESGQSLGCHRKGVENAADSGPRGERHPPGGDWYDVLAAAKPIEVAIERLLAFNALTIVGSDGGVGKSVLLYRIAEAAANGWQLRVR